MSDFSARPSCSLPLGIRYIYGHLCRNLVRAHFLATAAVDDQLTTVNSLRTMCQKAIDDERRRVQMVVEAMPRRMAKQQEEAAAKAQSDAQ